MNKMTLLNAKLAAKMTVKDVLQKVMLDLFPEEVNNATQSISATSNGASQSIQQLGANGAGGNVYQPPAAE